LSVFQCRGHQSVAHELWRHLPLANSLAVLEELVGQTQQTTDQKRWTFHVVSFQSAEFGQKAKPKMLGSNKSDCFLHIAHRMNKPLSMRSDPTPTQDSTSS
jgi:hypothetical protein